MTVQGRGVNLSRRGRPRTPLVLLETKGSKDIKYRGDGVVDPTAPDNPIRRRPAPKELREPGKGEWYRIIKQQKGLGASAWLTDSDYAALTLYCVSFDRAVEHWQLHSEWMARRADTLERWTEEAWHDGNLTEAQAADLAYDRWLDMDAKHKKLMAATHKMLLDAIRACSFMPDSRLRIAAAVTRSMNGDGKSGSKLGGTLQ